MQKNIYLIVLSFCLISCYTYQTKKPVAVTDITQGSKVSPNNNQNKSTAQSSNSNSQQTPVPVNVKERLVANKNFKIDVDGNSYKIVVDRWENDSLVAHATNNPKKILKFHKNQINSEKIAENRFSQPIADIITVVVYAGIGIGIWSLLK